ncbi:MAG: hypothetical protein BWX88_01959 [Planctomycetes bacterium ADurb.Bin126]|nr:MAG: hypothetical protein BWX88_01959 [Planctomycetes bacterium ADurb.Bin126]HOD84604.1 hypothetical protein [Phycisphaerae bacterium]HQL72978.1 hypothetical protein [Phycisphaerae bacterium]
MQNGLFKRHRTLVLIAVALLALAVVLHIAHVLIFRDPHHTIIYLFGDIAFLPVEVVVVAMVMERILASYERRSLLHKMNMVIGTFFSELGTQLLGELSPAVANLDPLRPNLCVAGNWDAARWKAAQGQAGQYPIKIDLDRIDLDHLKTLLQSKRDLLVLLLANPNLLEHEHFTDLLWAVSHLMEELAARSGFRELPSTDRDHLAGDIKRAFTRLICQWLPYCRHLQETYPYIFSIVVRTNPFKADPSPTVYA